MVKRYLNKKEILVFKKSVLKYLKTFENDRKRYEKILCFFFSPLENLSVESSASLHLTTAVTG